MSDKVYFLNCDNNYFYIRVYQCGIKVMDTMDDYYKKEGYISCLTDFGYSYGGDFITEKHYKSKIFKENN